MVSSASFFELVVFGIERVLVGQMVIKNQQYLNI